MAKKTETTRADEITTTPKARTLVIPPPNFQVATFRIVGTAPYVQHAFSAKARAIIKAAQEGGSTSRARKPREPKDFDALYQDAIHRSREGWMGIPAKAFREAMIDACRLTNLKMTNAKQSIFVEADGYDADDGTPLVRFASGEPHYHEAMVKLPTGVADVRARPMWEPGWEMLVAIKYDADQFTLADVGNLLQRSGIQVGVGEGRPFSKDSSGMGWGTFKVEG